MSWQLPRAPAWLTRKAGSSRRARLQPGHEVAQLHAAHAQHFESMPARERRLAIDRRRLALDPLAFDLDAPEPRDEHAPAQPLRPAGQQRIQTEHGVSSGSQVQDRFYASDMTE